MPRPTNYPDELLERGVRLVFESSRPISHVAGDLGIHPEALRKRVRQAEADGGRRADRERFGVEPICRTLDVSASAYYARRSGERSQR